MPINTYIFGCGHKGDSVLYVSHETYMHKNYCPVCFDNSLGLWALANKRCVLLKVKARCQQCGGKMELSAVAAANTRKFVCAECKERNAITADIQRKCKSRAGWVGI